jgi:6-phosphofructokinase 1
LLNKIAILTSGGDAPGMNACIRALVRTALYHKLDVAGVMHGYEGLINGEFIELNASSVANIIQRGGTILKTARSKSFMTEEGMKTAFENLQKNHIDALIVIGGNGTFKGAIAFNEKYKVPVIGIPGTIDNDLSGTDFTIGFDTAINTVINAVDKIRDTAESHDRLFFIEVMGRESGLIALNSGIGNGAELILIPETETKTEEIVSRLKAGRKSKSSKIIVVAEGDEAGGVFTLAKIIKEKLSNYDTRVSVLGHVQRGGSPTCMDRVLASRLGFAAIEALINGKEQVMIGLVNNKITYTPLKQSVTDLKKPDPDLIRMVEILSM